MTVLVLACNRARVDTNLSAEGDRPTTEDRLNPLPQNGPLTSAALAELARQPNMGTEAHDMYRQLMHELAWNQPGSKQMSRLGIRQAPADFVRESSANGRLVVLEIAGGMNLLGSPRFQALLRQMNLFLLTSKLIGPVGAGNVLERANVRDLPANLRSSFNGASADFGAVGMRVDHGRDLRITLNMANVSELRARQAISWLGAHVLSGDFYGVNELAPTNVEFIPKFESLLQVETTIRQRFGQSAQRPDGLIDAEIIRFVDRVKQSLVNRQVSEAAVFSGLPFLWNWSESYIGSWPKAVHRRLAIDTIRAIATAPEMGAEQLATHVRDYRDATRLMQQWEHALEPRNGLERFDLSMLPIEPGALDVNREQGNFEITAKMPVAPVLRKVQNPTTGKLEFVETLIDLTFDEKKALLGEYARILGDLHGPGSVVQDVSNAGGSHGHSLVIKYLVKVKTNTNTGEHEYTVELDGQSREYKVEDGEFKVAMNTVRGGSLEAVGGKAVMDQAYLLLRFFAASQMGLFPMRQSGGGHLTTGLENYLESARRTGNARSLARMFWLVHRFQGIFGFMIMDPARVKGAMPFYFSPKEDADRVPAEHEVGRRPFKHIDELLTFNGSVDEFMKRLVDSRYFSDREGRKMKYLFMNMLQALANYLDPSNIGPDYDIKKGEWYSLAPVKGNRFTKEGRGFDAPRDAFDAMLQLRLWRAIDAWALSDKPIPSGVVSQETYLEYGRYARNPDVALAEFSRFMDIIGMRGGFDKLYEVWLWRRMNEVQVDINAGTFVDVPERLRDMPRQFAPFKPGVSQPRTTAETSEILSKYERGELTPQEAAARAQRAAELAEQTAIRERELQNSSNRTVRDPNAPVTPEISDLEKARGRAEATQREMEKFLNGLPACEGLKVMYEQGR